MAPWRDGQHLFQLNTDAFIDGYCADFTTLALNGDGVLLEGLFRNGGVQPETLVDAQTGIPVEADDGGVVLVAVLQAEQREPPKLPLAPGAVHAPKRRRSNSTLSSSLDGSLYFALLILL